MRRRRRVSKKAFKVCFAAVASLAVSSAPASEITSTWSGNSGDWTDGTQWSTNPNYPNNGTPSGVEYDALINAPGTAAYTVSLSASITTDSLTLNSPNATLSQTGGTLNATTINISAGTYNLSGGNVQALNYIGGGTLALTNASATFDDNNVDNTGGAIETGTGSTAFFAFPNSTTTSQIGNLAVNGGDLRISTLKIDNTGQTLAFSGSTGTINVIDALIVNGAVDFPSITTLSHVGLENVTVDSDLTVTDDFLSLRGVDVQGHTINLEGHATELAIVPNSAGASSVTLCNAVVFLGNGAGVVATPFSGNAEPALTLGSNTLVHGYGKVGFSFGGQVDPLLTNQGTISADQNGQTLRIAPLVFTNIGTLQAINGGILNVFPTTTTFTNNGVLSIDSLSTIRAPQGIIFASGSAFDVTLGSNGASGILNSPGPIIQNNVSLNLSLAPGAIFSGPYEIISYSGGLRGAFSEVTPGFVVDYSQPGEILVTAIPEPCCVGALGTSVWLLLARRRRPVRRGDLPQHR